MSNAIRKLRRSVLKQQLKTNKINSAYHRMYDPLWKQLKAKEQRDQKVKVD